MTDIINAAPMVIDQGTQDLSTRVVPAQQLLFPQHLPKVYLFAEKGPVGPNYVDFDSSPITKIYGDNTFDVNSEYFTHQTPFAQKFAANANNCVIHRLIPDDANDRANVALYLDVLETQVPVYEKNSDGSLVVDEFNNPVVSLDSGDEPITVTGLKLAWVVDKTEALVGEYTPGMLTERPGVQVDEEVQSKQYPIFEFAAKDAGAGGNLLGVKLYAASNTDAMPFPAAQLVEGKQYPYYFGMSRVVDSISGKINVVMNSFGSQMAKLSLKSDGIDPASGANISLAKVVKDQYIDLPIALSTDLGTAHTYDGNLKTVLTMMYDLEKNITDDHRDSVIRNDEDNIYALNIFNFTSSNGSPYQTLKLVDVSGGVRLGKNTNVFLSGASNGTINEDVMDTLVAADLEKYADGLDQYQDQVGHPESIIYDSGFSLKTKKAFPKFISLRKDTFVALAPYAHDIGLSMLSDQTSVAIALKTMMELYPESSTFGTPVMRGVVMAGSGYINDSLYIKRVPTTYELAHKASRYMGAKNGKWTNGLRFDKAPLSVISQLKDLDITWVPTSTRNTLWSVGLNFPLNYQARRQFFPAIQTVYQDDTSVLNSFFTVVAISYLNKIAHAAWREFTGDVSLTSAQLENEVNNFVSAMVKDKFDGLFVIVPDCTVTEMDELRGFSWTLPIKIYSNNMKTVMSTNVIAQRMSDLG